MTNETHEPNDAHDSNRMPEPNDAHDLNRMPEPDDAHAPDRAHRPNVSGGPRTAHREPDTDTATDTPTDTAATARRARFGALPERVRPEDTVETRPATPRDPARDAYDPDEWLVRYCL
ncbi:hypothetical protein ACWDO6_26625 [Streptomyces sp. NPDC003674]|uniref:hypothetical protein n=1 Tax=Streptomyces sp. NPDC001037 TaxID=3364542 RepID=UPI0036970FF5